MLLHRKIDLRGPCLSAHNPPSLLQWIMKTLIAVVLILAGSSVAIKAADTPEFAAAFSRCQTRMVAEYPALLDPTAPLYGEMTRENAYAQLYEPGLFKNPEFAEVLLARVKARRPELFRTAQAPPFQPIAPQRPVTPPVQADVPGATHTLTTALTIPDGTTIPQGTQVTVMPTNEMNYTLHGTSKVSINGQIFEVPNSCLAPIKELIITHRPMADPNDEAYVCRRDQAIAAGASQAELDKIAADYNQANAVREQTEALRDVAAGISQLQQAQQAQQAQIQQIQSENNRR